MNGNLLKKNKMSKLKEYNKLEKLADKYFEKHETQCAEMLHLIEPMIDIGDKRCFIFNQAGDGYVLCWNGKNIFGKDSAFNTPVKPIIEEYEKQGQPLTEEELRLISV